MSSHHSERRLYAQAIRRHKQGRRRASLSVRLLRFLLILAGLAILFLGVYSALG